ncbi:hypothetical protein CONLIGDRAFT_648951 [Coniochaeta ligniaria NRRL 30616]|uniref:Uncharacterized protein n=1 Tax=Coniochaeta ligniaria NRRL 30616 TaxID=1408157 RepID=A0A1J7I9M3_9PEZI|nr:hypothetical protein CONLIGDRAFT_648951 [Coniochaeta ligniaria NRRL 30616]
MLKATQVDLEIWKPILQSSTLGRGNECWGFTAMGTVSQRTWRPARSQSTVLRISTASVSGLRRDNADVEVTKWQTLLWFGPAICITMRPIKDVSALTNTTNMTASLSSNQPTDRVWRKVLAARGDGPNIPWAQWHTSTPEGVQIFSTLSARTLERMSPSSSAVPKFLHHRLTDHPLG